MLDIIRDKINTNITINQFEKVVNEVLKNDDNSDYLKIGKTRTGDWSYDMVLLDSRDDSPAIKFEIVTVSHEVGGYHHTDIFATRPSVNDASQHESLGFVQSKKPKFDKDEIYDFVNKTINDEIDRTYYEEHRDLYGRG